jgi:transposase
VNRALRLAAQALQRDTSYLGDYYRKMCARLGRPAGITAAAHKLATIFFTGSRQDKPMTKAFLP